MPRQTKGPQNRSATIAAKLLEALATIDRPADFCTQGLCPSVLPGLHVKKFGDVGLPLSATEAKRLIKSCHQAPYGKGTETVVDTKVRNVWELDADDFSLKNPKWEGVIESILREIEGRLGLPEKSLVAHLYKLLVYEKGSFFLRCLDVCGKTIWGYMNIPKPADTKSAYDNINKFPKFNGRPYYQFLNLFFPDFKLIIVQNTRGQSGNGAQSYNGKQSAIGAQSYKGHYLFNYYETLFAHLLCLYKEGATKEEINDLLYNSILKERELYQYSKHKKTLEEIFTTVKHIDAV